MKHRGEILKTCVPFGDAVCVNEVEFLELQKVTTSNLFDQIYGILRDSINRRVFRVNEKISLVALAKEFGTSITPIREALRRLEAEGLIVTIPKVGTFVKGIDADHVRQIMDTRMMIDFWTIERFSAFPQRHRKQALEEMYEFIYEDHGNSSVDEDSHRDLLFHIKFVGLSGNINNVDIYRNLMNARMFTSGASVVTPETNARAWAQHVAIYEELLKERWAESRAAVKEHIEYSKNNLLELIELSGGLI